MELKKTPSKTSRLIKSNYNRDHKTTDIKYQTTLTQQHCKDECNINLIISKSVKTGIIGTGSGTRKPQFGDYQNINYRDMVSKVTEGEQLFESLPSALRTRFDNSVEKLIEFIDNDENREEAIDLGFLPPSKAPEEPKTKSKSDPSSDPKPSGEEPVTPNKEEPKKPA